MGEGYEESDVRIDCEGDAEGDGFTVIGKG